MARRIVLIDIGEGLSLSGVLPSVALFAEYSARLIARGGVAPYTYAIVEGVLPDGLFLDASTGIVSGTASAPGVFPFSVKCADLTGASVLRAFTLTVIAEPLSLIGAFADAQVGTPYVSDLTISGAVTPYSNPRVTFGVLPAGLVLSIVGDKLRLSGTPTGADGSVNLIVAIDSSDGQIATSEQSIEVTASSGFWTPAGLAVPPAVWLNDDMGTAIDDGNGNCSHWLDSSGNARDYSNNAVAGQRPVIINVGQNNRRVLAFDGIDDWLDGTSTCAALTNNVAAISIFIVADPEINASATTHRLVSFSIGAAVDTSARANINILNSQIVAVQRRLDGDAGKSASIAHTSKAWRIHQSEHDWLGQKVTIRLDGSLPTTTNTAQGTGNTQATDSNQASLGGTGSVGGQCTQTSIGELIVLSYIPSNDERQRIEGYLAWRWGTQGSLPVDHPYKAAPPAL